MSKQQVEELLNAKFSDFLSRFEEIQANKSYPDMKQVEQLIANSIASSVAQHLESHQPIPSTSGSESGPPQGIWMPSSAELPRCERDNPWRSVKDVPFQDEAFIFRYRRSNLV